MTVDWWDTGVGAYRRAFAGDWIALVWPTEDGLWEWLVATFDREADRGHCMTEPEAKASAEMALCKVASRACFPPSR